MKKTLVGILAISIWAISTLAVPNQLTYSGRLLQNGALVNSTLTMTFKIYDDPTSVLDTDLLWSTSNLSVIVNQGIYSVILDQVSPNVFANDNAYLEVVIDPSNANEKLLPRTKINSVGYALQAASVTGLSNVFPSSGNVGIGTTGPLYKLVVSGVGANNIGAELRNVGEVALRLYDTATNTWDISNDSNLKFLRGGSEKMRIDAGGNVGVGTANPTQKLYVKGVDDVAIVVDSNNDAGADSNAFFRAKSKGTSYSGLILESNSSTYNVSAAGALMGADPSAAIDDAYLSIMVGGI
ncbi:MAG: hypothetical protein WC838_05540, partial [Candidatus Margulisiibacteriota bacterium]